MVPQFNEGKIGDGRCGQQQGAELNGEEQPFIIIILNYILLFYTFNSIFNLFGHGDGGCRIGGVNWDDELFFLLFVCFNFFSRETHLYFLNTWNSNDNFLFI